jgi:uncharacterized damage-inducible protein DinB
VLRQELADLLTKGQAHVTVEQALDRLPPELRGRRPAAEIPSVFEQLEHMRLAQEDILRYTLDRAWESPAWPEGYWPAKGHVPTAAEWDDAVARFKRDLTGVVAVARDERRELTRRLPHGEGRTYLRQVLLVADHNAYHLGQLVQVLRLLGAWPA